MPERKRTEMQEGLLRELLEREQRLHDLIGQLIDQQSQDTASAPSNFSGRELSIIRELVHGSTNQQIGDELHLSAGTVRNYLGRIFRKFGVASRTEAAVRAIELGLVDRNQLSPAPRANGSPQVANGNSHTSTPQD